jgi:hypothetical protein
MNGYIYAFLMFGACFGWFSFPYRHLFSEGPTQSKAAQEMNVFDGRTFWVLLCGFLWPIMLLTGVNTAWVLFRRRRLRTLQQNSALRMAP